MTLGWHYPPGATVEREQAAFRCEHDHHFEGYVERELGAVVYVPDACPVCGTVEIEALS